ncbi:hypothetical protein Avbf_04880, partial [Armadillidium vulgare]
MYSKPVLEPLTFKFCYPFKLLLQDELQVQNVSEGTILSGDSLVLQRINQSAKRPLQPSFLYDKPINVSCTVSAFPPVTKLYWRLNGSKDTLDSPLAKPPTYNSASNSPLYDRSEGFFSVSPRLGLEDRELSCFGVNELGVQDKPCRFAIKVATIYVGVSVWVK